MDIDNHHWLTDPAVHLPIPGGSSMPVRRCLVVHFTSGASARSTIDFWKTAEARGASAHLVIDRDGTVYQVRPFNVTCGHAGVSKWEDPNTGTVYSGLNFCSIGMELANAGDDPSLAHRWSKLPLVVAPHRNGGPETSWEAYPDEQIEAATAVAKLLVARYHLDDITGHDCIAPSRKNDPGPAFPMREFRESLGFPGLPVVHW